MLTETVLNIPDHIRRQIVELEPALEQVLFPTGKLTRYQLRAPDLHALTRIHGVEAIAEILGCSPRALEDLRRGHTALTIDDLFELDRHFPRFDIVGTVYRLGEIRERKGRTRKIRKRDLKL